jgi:hypothetical protein
MGMFDYVNFEMHCSSCGELVKNFQSKSGPCRLYTLDPEYVQTMHAKCDRCGELIELVRGGTTKFGHYRKVPYTYDEIYEMGFRLYKDRYKTVGITNLEFGSDKSDK